LFHLGRHTWQCKDATGSTIIASNKVDPWCSAMWVVDDVRTQWEHCLDAIAFWHRTLATRKEILNVGERVGTELKWSIECRRDDFASQVVGCWSKATGGDDDIRTTCGVLKNVDIVLEAVTHGRVKGGLNSDLAQSLADPLAIGIQSIPARKLVTDGNYFCFQFIASY
jgi:hypothetical protein